MNKFSAAMTVGVAAIIVANASTALAAVTPRVRHVSNVVDVTRAGKSVKVLAEYRCAKGSAATVTARVTQHKTGHNTSSVTSVYDAAASAAVCNDRYHTYDMKVTRTNGSTLTTTGRTIVTVTLAPTGGPSRSRSRTAHVVNH